MATTSTIVIELGSARIKVGFAGEPRPRRVVNRWGRGGGGSGGPADAWFRRVAAPFPAAAHADGPGPAAVAAVDWEQILYPLLSHLVTSVLFVQRTSRHRLLLLINEAVPPRHFREGLRRVVLEYLDVGGVWLVSGGVFESVKYVTFGLPSATLSSGRPNAHLIVDIGTDEARVVVAVAGAPVLAHTQQNTVAGYHSFLGQVLKRYQEIHERGEEDETNEPAKSRVLTLEDANAIVQAWIARCSTPSSSLDSKTISVHLPSMEKPPLLRPPLELTQTPTHASVELPIQPLLRAFHLVYLDYSHPSSLIFNMLTCAMACPIDYRRVALQNVLLLGGGAVALRCFEGAVTAGRAGGLSRQLERAAREACGNEEEEKKEEGPRFLSPISGRRFRALSKAVAGHANHEGERREGIRVRYPDPFAADMAAWIGGSIMGTLGGPYQKKR